MLPLLPYVCLLAANCVCPLCVACPTFAGDVPQWRPYVRLRFACCALFDGLVFVLRCSTTILNNLPIEFEIVSIICKFNTFKY